VRHPVSAVGAAHAAPLETADAVIKDAPQGARFDSGVITTG
jgi:hypothetical protein